MISDLSLNTDVISLSKKKQIDPERRALLYKPLKTVKEKQGLKKPKEIKMQDGKIPEYKQNFLADFFDDVEQKMEFQKQMEIIQ